MEINIQATMGTCSEYMTEGFEIKKEASVVIAPLRVTTNEGSDKIQVTSGCNMWKSCFNPSCWYSIAARTKK